MIGKMIMYKKTFSIYNIYMIYYQCFQHIS